MTVQTHMAWQYRNPADLKCRRFQEEPLPGMRKKQEGNEMKVKKVLIDMIVKWHQAGYSLDEIAPLVPQVPKEEIKAIIQHTRE